MTNTCQTNSKHTNNTYSNTYMPPTHIPLTLNTSKNPIHIEEFQDSFNDAMHEDNSPTKILMH